MFLKKRAGSPDDWDPSLSQFFGDGSLLGIICEAKTGRYDCTDLFKTPNLVYSVRRLGLVDNADEVARQLSNQRSCDPSKGIRIVKLLIANDTVESEKFFCLSVEHVKLFFYSRFRKYNELKFSDRMFFQSELIQYVIDEVHARNRERQVWEEPPTEA
jgi:hypothetical protein